MALAQKLNPISTMEVPIPRNGQAGKSNIESTQAVKPICLEDLTPLQRQRLDTAVMMLVDYLVSASSGS
jgi:hypothetical protein